MENETTQQTVESADRLPVDQLAAMDHDKTIFYFGVVPLMVAGGLILVFAALYFYRRSKSWNDLGEAMRLEDEPANSNFNTRDMEELGDTQPSKSRLESEKSDAS